MKSKRWLQVLAGLTASTYLFEPVIAHMELSWPVPFRSKFNSNLRAASIDYDMVAPLQADGSDFPCKGYEHDSIQGIDADYHPGQTYNITLAGTIMHGGGSCQIAMSYDEGKMFRVFKSIIGGCPFKKTYDFTVPTFAPAGNAILAWTWQNNMGNREYYMNCADVEVTDPVTPSRRKRQQSNTFDTLPGLWVANLASINTCKTVENVSPVYPFPGPDVEYGWGYSSTSPPTAGDCEVPARFRQYGAGVPNPPIGWSPPPYTAPASTDLASSTTGKDGANETSGIPAKAAAHNSPIVTPIFTDADSTTTSHTVSTPGDFSDLYQRLNELRVGVATADPGTTTIYTTVSACPSELITTLYASGSPTWITSTVRPTSSPSSSSPDVAPFPPSSPPYVSTVSEANRELLPCVPGTLLCQSPSSFLTCAPTPPNDPLASSWTHIYGYSRAAAAGMACLPFLSPYTSSTAGSDPGRQDTGTGYGAHRDDRYVRDRPDGSCPPEREGRIRCKDGGQGFYVCDQGGWVDMGATSAGTTCVNGAIRSS